MKNKNGITLVALVITTIILLILAGITIGTLSDSGLFSKSKEAVNIYKKQAIIEDISLEIVEYKISITNPRKGTITKAKLEEILSWYGDVIYKDNNPDNDIIGVITKEVKNKEKDKTKVVKGFINKEIIIDEIVVKDDPISEERKHLIVKYIDKSEKEINPPEEVSQIEIVKVEGDITDFSVLEKMGRVKYEYRSPDISPIYPDAQQIKELDNFFDPVASSVSIDVEGIYYFTGNGLMVLNREQQSGGVIPMPFSINYEINVYDGIEETGWLDSDRPSSTQEGGDIEPLGDVIGKYYRTTGKAGKTKIGFAARASMYRDVSIIRLEQKIHMIIDVFSEETLEKALEKENKYVTIYVRVR